MKASSVSQICKALTDRYNKHGLTGFDLATLGPEIIETLHDLFQATGHQQFKEVGQGLRSDFLFIYPSAEKELPRFQ